MQSDCSEQAGKQTSNKQASYPNSDMELEYS